MIHWKQTLALRTFSLFKIPLLFIISPTVVKLTEKECEVRIPLNRLTRNHLKSMYFGVLAMGADCAGGLIAMEAIQQSKKKVSLIFKDFKADFLKRAEADVHFICKDGIKIRDQVQETIRTHKRVNQTLSIIATTPKISGDEPVAKFELTLSLKAQK
jgi:acyl-coenzyme A thioesterase PaaI-like protein